jgi:hypothetical protein
VCWSIAAYGSMHVPALSARTRTACETTSMCHTIFLQPLVPVMLLLQVCLLAS